MGGSGPCALLQAPSDGGPACRAGRGREQPYLNHSTERQASGRSVSGSPENFYVADFNALQPRFGDTFTTSVSGGGGGHNVIRLVSEARYARITGKRIIVKML